MPDEGDELVLVTGVSGSIAGALAAALQKAGYRVRGTVRDPSNADTVGHVAALCPGIELVAADLLSDEGWDAACAGCKFVHHVASPFPIVNPEEEALLRPAVEGTKRVLAAAAAAGVARVVLTSSCAAISSGHEGTPKADASYVYTEADWSDPDKCQPYTKSKTLAERAAWEFVAGASLELTTINPCYVQGPMTSARNCSSFTLIRRLLTGDMPALANVGIAICDMRDVVAAHVAAMTTPAAAGQRYIIHSRSVFLPDVAALLHREFQPRGFPVPTRRAPKFVIALYALFDAEGRAVLASVDKVAQYDHGKAERELGLQMTPWEDAVRGTAESLIALSVVNVAGAK